MATKSTARRVLWLFLLLAAALLFLMMVSSENAVAEGQIISIPMDETRFPALDPTYYLSDTLYEDPSISVSIESGRAYNSYYYAARIRIANATQLRSSMASSNGKDTERGERLAKRVNAVLAINGDFYRTNQPTVGKYIVRQGILKQKNPSGYLDLLIIDDKGDFHILPEARLADVEPYVGTIVNSYTFGPGLVIDGVKTTVFEDRGYGPTKRAQRMAICQTGPLEYLCVVTSGPDHDNSTGLLIDEFTDLICSLGPVIDAYNLDGGTSACMVWRNEKLNSFGSSKYRAINDIIYFASAWRE